MRIHTSKVTQTESIPSNNRPEAVNKNYSCHKCNHNASSKELLRQHIGIEHLDKYDDVNFDAILGT